MNLTSKVERNTNIVDIWDLYVINICLTLLDTLDELTQLLTQQIEYYCQQTRNKSVLKSLKIFDFQ